MDVRAAIVRALTPAAGRVAPDTARAAAAFIAAAAAKQPMLAESMLLPAKLAGGDEESALDALWECLGDAKTMRAENPRMLASATAALVAVWGGGRLLGGAVDALRSQPELVERLEKCLPSATEAVPAAEKDEEEEEEAFRLAAEADALTILASEAAAVMDGPAPAEGSVVSRAVARWCRADADNGECALSRWTRRWTMTRVDRGVFAAARSRAHAVVLLAAANAARARARRAPPDVRRRAPLPDATLGMSPPPRGGASLARGGGGSRRRRRAARRCARNRRRRRRRRRRGRASSRAG